MLICCRAEGASETIIYKVEVPANRYDLLCMEGLVTGLLIFQQKCSAPVYRRLVPDNMLEVFTKPATADVRPFVIGAVLRGVKMTPDRYQSFIDLQVSYGSPPPFVGMHLADTLVNFVVTFFTLL